MSTPRPVTDDDLVVLRLIHAALRRDLARLTAAADQPALDQHGLNALRDQWAAFAHQLHEHHQTEDRLVWPAVRQRAGAAAEAVLASMEAEHATIDPALARVETALAGAAPGRSAGELRAALACLRDLLGAHLAHEEADAIPLVCRHLTGADLDHVAAVQRRQGGLRGARAFLPWVLDQAAATDRDHVLRELPPPLRLLVRRWERQRHTASGKALPLVSPTALEETAVSKTARAGAGVLLAAPLVAIIANVVPPTISEEAGDRVAALTDHHTAMVLGTAADAIAIALMIGGVIWLAAGLRSRAPRLALTGGVLGVIGALVVLFVDGMAAAEAAVVDTLSRAQATSVLDAVDSSGAGRVEPLSLLLNVGLICLGVAAVKVGAPTWLAAALAVGAVAQGAGLATGTRLLALVGFAVVFLSLAGVVRVLAGAPARQLLPATASPARRLGA